MLSSIDLRGFSSQLHLTLHFDRVLHRSRLGRHVRCLNELRLQYVAFLAFCSLISGHHQMLGHSYVSFHWGPHGMKALLTSRAEILLKVLSGFS